MSRSNISLTPSSYFAICHPEYDDEKKIKLRKFFFGVHHLLTQTQSNKVVQESLEALHTARLSKQYLSTVQIPEEAQKGPSILKWASDLADALPELVACLNQAVKIDSSVSVKCALADLARDLIENEGLCFKKSFVLESGSERKVSVNQERSSHMSAVMRCFFDDNGPHTEPFYKSLLTSLEVYRDLAILPPTPSAPTPEEEEFKAPVKLHSPTVVARINGATTDQPNKCCVLL